MRIQLLVACAVLLGGCASLHGDPAPNLSPAQECRRKCEDTYFSCTAGCGTVEECILTHCGAPRTACLEKCPRL
jgi:hypothetical protein